MFISWALDQQDRIDSVGKMAKVMWADYNAGCASMYGDPVSWKVHFESSHRKNAAVLLDWLSDMYVEYCFGLGTKTDEF